MVVGPIGSGYFLLQSRKQEKIDDQLHNIDVVWANVISEYDFLNLDLIFQIMNWLLTKLIR